ncbi:MarR family transcriptional regulator [Sphingomonas sp. AR_OL41]|uniref:LexA family protein n=1 Tax=Sphingomonas sp. AR_OL41 TaxID=3042729 RepID=UPI002481727E|nr:MarR family transcriptional regulator [Sphingomonas sp. AR_OL41]MDH7971746.1 MarR family transcriptional regulator [Sphingomonas sp. AR_OL41]
MTPIEVRALEFVRDFIDTRGFAPSLVEIAKELEVSRPRVTQLVKALVDQGQLTKEGRKWRSLEIVGVTDLRAVPTSRLQAELGRRGVNLSALAVPETRSWSRHAVTCAVDSCDIVVKRGHLMCRTHWFAVPYAMQEGMKLANSAGDGATYQDLFWRAKEIAARATARKVA